MTRTPSNRATATAHSPIKEIKRVQNDVRQHNNIHSRTMPKHGYSAAAAAEHYANEEDEERFSRFTEYRGGHNGHASNTMGREEEEAVQCGGERRNR